MGGTMAEWLLVLAAVALTAGTARKDLGWNYSRSVFFGSAIYNFTCQLTITIG